MLSQKTTFIYLELERRHSVQCPALNLEAERRESLEDLGEEDLQSAGATTFKTTQIRMQQHKMLLKNISYNI